MNKLWRILSSSLLLILVWPGVHELQAQSGIFDRTGIVAGHGSYGSLPEENIDLFTGNVTLRYRDIYLPGPNGLDVEIWRVYNSKILKDRQSGSPVVQAYQFSWVGMGWTIHMGMIHNFSSSTPVIEFPDGRLETAYPNYYGLGSNIYLTRDFLKYDKTYNQVYQIFPKLYFKNGVVWTFGASAIIPRADGTQDQVRLVTKIENSLGHSITVRYIAGTHYIDTIEDSMGRTVTFVSEGTPRKLTQIRTKDVGNNDKIFSYSVGNWPNGYHRLDSFTPPLLAATSFEYYDGSLSQYELTRITTNYGGVLEYSFENHNFYFNTVCLDSRVARQKRITFNPGEQPATWNFSYPSYNGEPTGTTQVDGPLYDESFTFTGYDPANLWKIGLIGSHQKSDGSYQETYDWTWQQISSTSWYVLGANMGTAKGPLPFTIIRAPIGNAASKTEYLYERADPKRYGLPSAEKTYFQGGGSLKNTKSLTYYYEAHNGFRTRYMLDFLQSEAVSSSQSPPQLLSRTTTSYFEETGKWGALKQIKKYMPTGDLVWDYTYSCDNPNTVHISIDPPGNAEKQYISYLYGVKQKETMPDFGALDRMISPYDSSITSEKLQDEGFRFFGYDNLGRIELIDLDGPWNDIDYVWQPDGENKVVLTQGSNVITKFWDGMGRDTGYTESGDGTTLYYLITLDAEGRIISESKGSANPAHVFSYAHNSAGQVTSITDPLGEATMIEYAQTSPIKTITDAEDNSTVYEYGDLPGLPTRVTDALDHQAEYTYDAVGRLTFVRFNGTRDHSYTYDHVDNVTSEAHPETGMIIYEYNAANQLYKKTWGGSVLEFHYDGSGRVGSTQTTGSWVYYQYSPVNGRLQSTRDAITGWRRDDLKYNPYGKPTEEWVTIPGLPQKRINYTYDMNNNPTGTILDGVGIPTIDGPGTAITNNGLNMPETVSFKKERTSQPDLLVSDVSYGPGKMPINVDISGNGTEYSATYNNAGMLSTASLKKGASTLYNAAYAYDGVGNIATISSTIPALDATFGYDPLNRLTSASYSSGEVGTHTYQYDAYGNMLSVLHDGVAAFNKTYLNSNRIVGFSYDNRGNLISSGGNIYYWDAQNRLTYIQNSAGEVIGKYLYDDRGLRLRALPPLPEITIRHDQLDIPSGGDVFLRATVGNSINETLTVHNLGDANLNLSELTITGDTGDFSVIQHPASPVLPGSSANFIVQFRPQSAGHKIALLTIPSNDIDEGQYLINLYGNYEPEIDIIHAPDGGSWDFGERGIGDYFEIVFSIDNVGEKELVLGGIPIIVISGPDSDQFSVEQQPVSPVQPAGTTTFNVRFSPMSEGLKMATISIVNNDWDENPYDITLYGTGVLAPMRIAEETAFVVTSPVEGDMLAPGSAWDIAWTGAGEVKEVRIEYSTDNGSTYQTVVERTQNTGSYPWLVPDVASGVCLIRVMDADGPATSPKTFSFELKLNIPSEGFERAKAPALTLHAVAPDTRTQTSWEADLILSPDRTQDDQGASLNSAEGNFGPLKEFLDRWHHVLIQLELESYTATVSLNGRVVMGKIPLRQSLGTVLLPEITVTSSSDSASSILIEDLQVAFCDQLLKPQVEGEDVTQPIVRDTFEAYETGVFPKTGGWLTGMENILSLSTQDMTPANVEDEAVLATRRSSSFNKAQRGTERGQGRQGVLRPGESTVQTLGDPASAEGIALIDEVARFSGRKSFRLETLAEGSISVAKRLSIPERVPFGVSGGTFGIGPFIADSGLRAVEAEAQTDCEAGPEIRIKSGGKGDTPPWREAEISAERIRLTQGTAEKSAAPAGTSSSAKTMTMLSTARTGNYYLYSFDGKLLRQYDVYGVLLKDFIYMGDRLLAEYDRVGNRYLYYTQDQINSTRIVTDNAGTVVYSEAYAPYGGVQETWVDSFDPLAKFSGKERDAESQLDYFGARYYDSSQYRFISIDPKLISQEATVDPQRWSLYTYCSDNPINRIDPDGKWGYKVHFGWTERIAIMAGISEPMARTIAKADFGVDLPKTMFRKEWHIISTEKYAEALKICDSTLDPKELGRYLHVIQDFFSHSAVALAGKKHSPAMDKPFSGYHEWGKTMEMAQLTLDILRAFKERLAAAAVAAVQSIGISLAGI